MTPLLVALLLVLLLPMFAASWRANLLGLAGQGLLSAWIAWRLHGCHGASDVLTYVDLVLVRGLFAPLALRQVLAAHRASPRHDVIPPNLLSWALAFAVVVLAFPFAEALEPKPGQAQALVAVATACLLLGFLVLATEPRPSGQVVGALRIENAIALFELGGEHHWPIGVQAGQVAVVVMTIALYRWYLDRLALGGEGRGSAGPEGPTL